MPTLDWIGKRAVANHHREVPFHLLEVDPELSVGDPDSGNLIVQGDNLLALKALLPYYAGQVKCIYIDPPYNTGNEGWVYNDAVNSPEIREWLGRVVGDEAADLSRHDKWLCMMYPRLQLLKEFLRDDGVIFVSIADDSIGYLRLLMDEVFSPQRFVATVVWQKRYSRENRSAIGDVHEYILVYATNPDAFKHVRNRVSIDEKSAAVYKNPNGDPRGRWRPIPMTAQGYRPNQMYDILTPAGNVVRPPRGRCWSTIEPEFKKLREAGLIWFGKKGDSQPNIIRYLDEVEGLVPWTWWPHDEVGHTDEAKKEVQSFAGAEDAFPTPKPERLMRRIIEIATNPDDIVLDAFAGSGTTGAVAQKLGRRYVLVEGQEYAHVLIPARLRAVIAGEDPNGITAAVNWSGGGGFQFATLGSSIIDGEGRLRENLPRDALARYISFLEGGAGVPRVGKTDRPVHDDRETRLFVLYDESSRTPIILTPAILASLPPHDGPKIIYAEGCRLSAERLRRENIIFKQIPYDLRTS